MEHVKSLFEEDDALSSHVDGDLKFRFLDVHKVRLSYTFSCHDENPAEGQLQDEVGRINGAVDFEDAYKYQKRET